MGNLAPSASLWFGLFRNLWGRLSTRERFVLFGSLLLPAANRISHLGSFGVTVRCITHSIRHDLDPTTEYLLAGVVFASFLVAAGIQAAAGSVETSLKRLTLRLSRDLMADNLVVRSGEKGKASARVRGGGGGSFAKRVARLLYTIVSFGSLVVLCVSLLGVIFYISPLIAAIVAGLGVTLFAFLRARIRTSTRNEGRDMKAARIRLDRIALQIAESKREDEELRTSYVDNEFDRLSIDETRRQRVRQAKIVLMAGVGSGIAMGAAFFYASRGYFEKLDPALVIVLILALRLCVMQGRNAMDRWSTMLGERPLLARLRQMASAGSSRETALPEEPESDSLPPTKMPEALEK